MKGSCAAETNLTIRSDCRFLPLIDSRRIDATIADLEEAPRQASLTIKLFVIVALLVGIALLYASQGAPSLMAFALGLSLLAIVVVPFGLAGFAHEPGALSAVVTAEALTFDVRRASAVWGVLLATVATVTTVLWILALGDQQAFAVLGWYERRIGWLVVVFIVIGLVQTWRALRTPAVTLSAQGVHIGNAQPVAWRDLAPTVATSKSLVISAINPARVYKHDLSMLKSDPRVVARLIDESREQGGFDPSRFVPES